MFCRIYENLFFYWLLTHKSENFPIFSCNAVYHIIFQRMGPDYAKIGPCPHGLILSKRKRVSLVVSTLAFSARGHGEEKFRCPNMLSLVSLAGMTLNKCAVLRIGMLTGGPLFRKS